MEINFKYEITTKDNKMLRRGEGNAEINYEKYKEIQKLCFEWGYDITSFIDFMLENISKESAEQILATMESAPRNEE